eukprot:COSAG01_NODE_12931_length_1661_cov_2.455186_2_plen_175_part_00
MDAPLLPSRLLMLPLVREREGDPYISHATKFVNGVAIASGARSGPTAHQTAVCALRQLLKVLYHALKLTLARFRAGCLTVTAITIGELAAPCRRQHLVNRLLIQPHVGLRTHALELGPREVPQLLRTPDRPVERQLQRTQNDTAAQSSKMSTKQGDNKIARVLDEVRDPCLEAT